MGPMATLLRLRGVVAPGCLGSGAAEWLGRYAATVTGSCRPRFSPATLAALCHSYRSATIGSTLVARRAGSQHASNATPASTATAAA